MRHVVPILLTLALAVPLPATDAATYGGCAGTVAERVLDATPQTYQGLIATLGPGDLLRLAAGTYTQGLSLHNLSGTPDRCIIVEGPASGPPAVFTGRDCCNTVSLADASYLVIRNLELDGQGRLGDGVKAEGTAQWVHHITLENLTIHGHGADQQIVGINSKCPAWNWVIRRNIIEAAGTGLYLGDSNGSAEHVNSLVEHNLVVDTRGYNMQVKHQNGRATGLGIPAAGTTIIRHNVFSKATNGSSGGNARPNLLVGHWPLSGPGAEDNYLIYGNFFYQNPTEALFQGEGHVIFYDNLLVNDFGPAVHIQPHNDVPKRIRLAHNTVVASGTGLRITGGASAYVQRSLGNAVFAATPLAGGEQVGNITDTYAAAATYLGNPDGQLSGASDRFDLYPLPATLNGTPLAVGDLAAFTDSDRDFNSTLRPFTFRGAYAGDGSNPGWRPALERKPSAGLVIFADGFESGNLLAWSTTLP